jgi:signal transduction histidine kinase
MRPSPLARRWLDARHLVAGLSLVVVALALLAYWAWQASVRRHQVAIELLRSHAELAAQRLGARMQNELYLSATAAFRPALAAARSSGTGAFDPNTLLAAAREAEACNCVPPLKPAYALRTDLTAAGTVFAGPASPSDSERESLLAALRDELAKMPNGWDIAVLRGNAGVGGRVVLFTRRDRNESPPVIVGVATDSATLREFIIRPLLCNTPLVVAGDRTRDIPNDSLVALRIMDASGVELYRTSAPVDASIASTTRFPVEWGELVIVSALRPRAALLVLPGGAPRSPVPMLVGLLLTATTLVAVAALMLWRTHDLSRARADFTSSVSHELRTPLTQILLYAETIELGRQRSPAKRAEAIAVITRETRRLIHLVENVLQFSRAEQRLTRLRLQPVELGELVAETVAAFGPVAEARDMAVCLRLDGPVVARADADAIRRIVLNLLDNAVRYGPSGQTVTVRVERAGIWARIVIEDEGPGISAPRRDDVWKPFVRLGDDGDASTTGCGIGLSIVSELVALHGGRRAVLPRAGGGASFSVEVPADSHSQSAPPSAASRDERVTLGAGGR